jgi:predicted XRE-type DNA-binding protein
MTRVKATKARKSRANTNVETSSGNVFADLGFQDAEERLLKANLATKIAQLIEKKGWTQAQTSERQLWSDLR